MLNSIDAMDTIRDTREAALIELTAKAHEAALQPLGHGNTDAICDYAREMLRVCGAAA